MIINSDGGSTPNKYLSLWPFILTLNELPIPERRYLENILVAGIMPTGKKPTNSVVQTCLNLIYEQLIQLEFGQEFFINDIDQRKIIHFYNIASCTDKPAAALMENVVQYNAGYGCPKCFHAGELYHEQRRVDANEVKFTIRVYPFTEFQLRTQDKCSQIVEELANYPNQINNNNPVRIKKTTTLAKIKNKKQKKEAHYGHLVQTPSTTQRRFRSLKLIAKYKGSEFRCLFHFGSTAILQPINLASANYVTDESIEAVKKILNYFVQHFQNIFGLRHMSSNIHSLLHIHECLKFIDPLWFYSTFAFEGIDKDLISTVHGTTEFTKQLIRQNILYRDAIIQHNNERYPMILFTFNEDLLNRKQSKIHYKNFVDLCYLPNSVSKELYDTSENGIATHVQSFFNDDLTFYHSSIISSVLLKTTVVKHGKLVADSCISFHFAEDQTRYGLIRAIVKSKQNSVRLFIEELIEKKPESSKFKFKINDEQYQIPNILRLKRSNIFHLKHPKYFLKKNAIVCEPETNHVPSLAPEIYGTNTFDFGNDLDVPLVAENLASGVKYLINTLKTIPLPDIHDQCQIE
ncbi:unnamed protein product [Rotaria sp. Silwood2]|nr:unnamed protein product [Rotaria sp. Silwood2]